MDNQEFIDFFLRVMHMAHFKSKRNMASALGIEYRTLQINFTKLDCPNRAFLGFQNLVLYCEAQGISIDMLFMLYQDGIIPKVSAPGKLSGKLQTISHLRFPGAHKGAYVWYARRCTVGSVTMFW